MKQKIKVVFLGTNGWYASNTGHTTCVFIESHDCYIIVDAGTGIYKLDQYIMDDKPIFLFLSHFHLEHICGLHILNKFHFKQKMIICCYKSGKKYLDQILAPPYTVPLKDLPFQAEVRELEEGVATGFPFVLTCREVVHASKCFAYRFEIGNKIISCCLDTGICAAIKDISGNADLVIAECSQQSGQKNTKWPHLNPEDAASLAKNSGAKKLALLHFDALNYQTLARRKKAESAARKIFKNTVATLDNMEIEI